MSRMGMFTVGFGQVVGGSALLDADPMPGFDADPMPGFDADPMPGFDADPMPG